jgi:hypothetical protein
MHVCLDALVKCRIASATIVCWSVLLSKFLNYLTVEKIDDASLSIYHKIQHLSMKIKSWSSCSFKILESEARQLGISHKKILPDSKQVSMLEDKLRQENLLVIDGRIIAKDKPMLSKLNALLASIICLKHRQRPSCFSRMKMVEFLSTTIVDGMHCITIHDHKTGEKYASMALWLFK